jgi:hypothetical protein
MSLAKKFQPHCPALGCSGGHADRLHEVSLEQIEIPQVILARKRDTDNQIWRCSYCGLVWLQKSTSRPGFDPLPLGYYTNLEFAPVYNAFKIREGNKANYPSRRPWHNLKKAKR